MLQCSSFQAAYALCSCSLLSGSINLASCFSLSVPFLSLPSHNATSSFSLLIVTTIGAGGGVLSSSLVTSLSNFPITCLGLYLCFPACILQPGWLTCDTLLCLQVTSGTSWPFWLWCILLVTVFCVF